MQIYKIKSFSKRTVKEGLTDQQLFVAVIEIKKGLVDAHLGGNVFKKRIALSGQGKRGGARTLLAYQAGSKVFFIYGFAKSDKVNVNKAELTALKLFATQLLNYTNKQQELLLRNYCYFVFISFNK